MEDLSPSIPEGKTSELGSIIDKIVTPHETAIRDEIKDEKKLLRRTMSDLRYPLLIWS
jgi:hypothetical protein